MLLDSGTLICSLLTPTDDIDIRVCGEVRVNFNGDVYRHFSDFPEELKKIFQETNFWENEDIYIVFNNWFELFNNKIRESLVVDIENYTPLQLLSLCLDSRE